MQQASKARSRLSLLDHAFPRVVGTPLEYREEEENWKDLKKMEGTDEWGEDCTFKSSQGSGTGHNFTLSK